MFNSKTEQRINFEIFGKIQALMEVYGKECVSRTRVFEWHKRFHEGQTVKLKMMNVHDAQPYQKPLTITEKSKKLSEKIVGLVFD